MARALLNPMGFVHRSPELSSAVRHDKDYKLDDTNLLASSVPIRIVELLKIELELKNSAVLVELKKALESLENS